MNIFNLSFVWKSLLNSLLKVLKLFTYDGDKSDF